MDARKIITQEGYTYDNLNDQNKDIIHWLRYLLSCLDGFDYEVGEGIMAQMVKEISEGTIEDLKEYLDATIAEIQISLLESQEDA